MVLYFKYILKSFKRNIYQPLMIILIITLSCTVFFSSLNFLNVFNQYYTTRNDFKFGNADISITVGSLSKTRFMQMRYINNIVSEEDEVYGMYTFSSLYYHDNKSNLINTLGMNFDKANQLSKIEFIYKTTVVEISINKIAVVSDRFANKFNLKLGDSFSLKMADNYETYIIYGVAKNTGLFFENDILLNDEGVVNIFLEALGLSILKGNLIYNQFLIKTNNIENVYGKIKSSEYFKDKDITTKNNTLNDSIKNLETLLIILIVLFTIILCVVFIYSVLILLINKRLKVLNLFKSVGARNYQLVLCLLFEILIYAFIGVIISLFLGKHSSYQIVKKFLVNGVNLKIYSSFYIYTIIFGISIAFLSTILEITRTAKRPVNLILKDFNKTYVSPKKVIVFILVILFILTYCIIKFVNDIKVNYLAYPLTLLSITLIYILSSLAIVYLYKLLKKSKINCLKLISTLSSNQKSYHIANKMFIISFTILLSVLLATSIFRDFHNKSDKLLNEGINIVNISDPSNKLLSEVKIVDGVKEILPYYQSIGNIGYDNYQIFIIGLNGNIVNEIIDSNNIKIIYKKEYKDNSIILPIGLIEKNSFKYGEEVELTILGEKYLFELCGYIDSPLPFLIININSSNLNYNSMLVKCDNKDIVYQDLSQRFSFKSFYILHNNDFLEPERIVVNSIVEMLELLSYIIMFALFIGVINNFIMSNIFEIKNFQILKRLGYGNFDILKISFLEHLINLLIIEGFILSGAYFINTTFSSFLKLSGYYSTFKINTYIYLYIISTSSILYICLCLIKYLIYRKTKANVIYE